jgi:hypothetical protein
VWAFSFTKETGFEPGFGEAKRRRRQPLSRQTVDALEIQ